MSVLSDTGALTRRIDGGPMKYGSLVAVILLAYGVATMSFWRARDFVDDGPLSLYSPELTEPLAGGIPLDRVVDSCSKLSGASSDSSYTWRVVGGEVSGSDWYACFQVKPDGSVFKAEVLTPDGLVAPRDIARKGGSWRWIGTVKTVNELILGGFGLAAVCALFFIYYRRPRPGRPAEEPLTHRRFVDGLAGSAFGLLLLIIPFRKQSKQRKIRLALMVVIGWTFAVLASIAIIAVDTPEIVSIGTTLVLCGGALVALGGARAFLRPSNWDYLEPLDSSSAPGPQVSRPVTSLDPTLPQSPASSQPPASALSGPKVTPPTLAASGKSVTKPRDRQTKRQADSAGPDDLRIEPLGAGELPNFSQVGGMSALKTELEDSIGLLLSHPHEAARYNVEFNGILLHGPPGVGKSFIAKATAGEFGMSFINVTAGDLVSSYVGQTARNIARCFEIAATNIPCLLFFDEFDSIATRRDDEPSQENRRAVNQLLQSLEKWRIRQDLIVMAATNHLDKLDDAAIRPGRFDRHIRVELPDRSARIAILKAQLMGRPLAEVDYDEIADRTAGLTPAALTSIVNGAAMRAYRRTTRGDAGVVHIGTAELREAMDARGGKDRPTVEDWGWDRLVLPPQLEDELRQLVQLLSDPDLAISYGIDPPSGVLLTGPPGTGKTTIARVLAAESGCSFYSVTAGDLTSKWVGESEQLISKQFERARANAPSIIFIDEIDSIGATRGSASSYSDRQLTQLLAEIDGMGKRGRVLVIGATNRADILDSALTRGGRLSRTIEVKPPNRSGRLRLLEILTERMPLVDVSLTALADQTDGLTGADLEALCSQAAVAAMQRGQSVNDVPTVLTIDFEKAAAAITGVSLREKPSKNIAEGYI